MESALMLWMLLLLRLPVLLHLVIIILRLVMFMLMAMPASAAAQVRWAMLVRLGLHLAASLVLSPRVLEKTPSPTITFSWPYLPASALSGLSTSSAWPFLWWYDCLKLCRISILYKWSIFYTCMWLLLVYIFYFYFQNIYEWVFFGVTLTYFF